MVGSFAGGLAGMGFTGAGAGAGAGTKTGEGRGGETEIEAGGVGAGAERVTGSGNWTGAEAVGSGGTRVPDSLAGVGGVDSDGSDMAGSRTGASGFDSGITRDEAEFMALFEFIGVWAGRVDEEEFFVLLRLRAEEMEEDFCFCLTFWDLFLNMDGK